MVTSNADHVELRLNGKRVADGPVDKYQMATFEVPYAPGKLEAIASNQGREVARYAAETTGPPAAVRLVPDRLSLAGDGYDAQPVTVEVVDAQGRVVPTADQLVTFTVTGPGSIIGLNNGDPTNHEPEKGTQHQVYNGLAQIIVQSQFAGQGKLMLHAASATLASGNATIDIAPSAARPAVPALDNPPLVVLGWKRSPVTAERPDPNQQMLSSDMNSWGDAHPGSWLPPFRNGRFAVYRAHFTPRAATQADGGKLVLRDVAGKAQVWLDGKMVAERDTTDKADIIVALPPGAGERVISILIESPAPGASAGLGGVVTIE
jgi:beta-galactosidase